MSDSRNLLGKHAVMFGAGGSIGAAVAKGFAADLRVCGPRSVTVHSADGSINHGSGEFLEIDAPRKLVMTRKFQKHLLLGTRETTVTCLCSAKSPYFCVEPGYCIFFQAMKPCTRTHGDYN